MQAYLCFCQNKLWIFDRDGVSASLVTQMRPSCTCWSCVYYYCCLLNTGNTQFQKKPQRECFMHTRTVLLSFKYHVSSLPFKCTLISQGYWICRRSLFHLWSEVNQVEILVVLVFMLTYCLLSQYCMADRNKFRVQMIWIITFVCFLGILYIINNHYRSKWILTASGLLVVWLVDMFVSDQIPVGQTIAGVTFIRPCVHKLKTPGALVQY